MNIFKPSTWFKKSAEISHVFCKLTPDFPHQGLDHFTDEAKCSYQYGLKVTGCTLPEAKAHLLGKVLDWARLSDKLWKAIESGKQPEISFEDLKRFFR